jgi:hypothetical protein
MMVCVFVVVCIRERCCCSVKFIIVNQYKDGLRRIPLLQYPLA